MIKIKNKNKICFICLLNFIQFLAVVLHHLFFSLFNLTKKIFFAILFIQIQKKTKQNTRVKRVNCSSSSSSLFAFSVVPLGGGQGHRATSFASTLVSTRTSECSSSGDRPWSPPAPLPADWSFFATAAKWFWVSCQQTKAHARRASSITCCCCSPPGAGFSAGVSGWWSLSSRKLMKTICNYFVFIFAIFFLKICCSYFIDFIK